MKEQKQNPEDMFDITGADSVSKFLLNPVGATTAFIEFIGGIIFAIFRTLAVPIETLTRYRFGARHFNLYLYIGGSLWFWAFAFLSYFDFGKKFGFNGDLVSNGVIFTIVGIVFYGAMIWHLIIKKFLAIEADMYTRYDGNVIPFYYRLPFTRDKAGNVREYLIRQIYEPATLYLLGVIIGIFINGQFGLWLTFASFAMALKEYVSAQRYRNMMYDSIDAQIMATSLKGAVGGKQPKDNQGIYFTGIPTNGKLKDKFVESLSGNNKPFVAE